MVGYHPQVILAGRRINDGMGKFIAEQTVKHMIRNGSRVKGALVNVMGLTFKEDCPDIRNTKVIDVIQELKSYGLDVHVSDPVADGAEALHEYGLKLENWDELPRADAVVVAVAHKQFLARPVTDFYAKVVANGCFVDVKSRFDMPALQKAGLTVWRL
jgi:UDP-N-acetyl-D-galactosamine dehydrogenase